MVQKAYTGAEVVDIDDKVAEQENLGSLDGVLVASIRRKGAADKAGLASGDVIRYVNGKKVKSKASFDEIINAMSPGDQIEIKYERNKRIYETPLTLENILGNTDILKKENSLNEEDIHYSEFLGVQFRRLTESEKESLRIPYGVKVSKIDQEKGFFRKLDDIEEGDIILAVNGRYVSNPEGLAQYIEQYYGKIYFEIIDKRGRQRTESYRFGR